MGTRAGCGESWSLRWLLGGSAVYHRANRPFFSAGSQIAKKLALRIRVSL
jgi:hypothetical protein